jgi:competence ComEA-like helix-hairpin-helix protein
MGPYALRQRGVLLLFLILLFFMGVRLEFLRHHPAKAVAKSIPPSPFIVEARGIAGRPALLTYTHAPTFDQILQDTESSTAVSFGPAARPDFTRSREISLTFFFDSEGRLRYREGPCSVKTLWILGRPLPLNRATAEELALLPGIGPVLAARITAFRTDRGGFTSLHQLMEIKGIKEKTFKKIKAYLTL